MGNMADFHARSAERISRKVEFSRTYDDGIFSQADAPPPSNPRQITPKQVSPLQRDGGSAHNERGLHGRARAAEEGVTSLRINHQTHWKPQPDMSYGAILKRRRGGVVPPV